MARPGLEPGTPRFSVVRSELSNGLDIPANVAVCTRCVLPADAAGVCVVLDLRPFRRVTAHEGRCRPFRRARLLTEQVSLDWPARAILRRTLSRRVAGAGPGRGKPHAALDTA